MARPAVLLNRLCGCSSGTSVGRSGDWAAGLSDFSSLEDFTDGAAAITEDDTAAWGQSGYHLSNTPDRRVLCTSSFLQMQEC